MTTKQEPDIFSDIDLFSPVAVYLQIENRVQFAIASGRLKSRDRLPSVRELSERLDVNPNTVAKAYRDLEVMGLVYTRRGKGIFIRDDVEEKCRDMCHNYVTERLAQVVAQGKAAGMSESALKKAVNASYGEDATLYGKTPAAVLKVAKSGGKKA